MRAVLSVSTVYLQFKDRREGEIPFLFIYKKFAFVELRVRLLQACLSYLVSEGISNPGRAMHELRL